MRLYELVCILEEKQLVEKVEDWIKKEKGKIKKKEEWGKKELAYPIKKQTEGFYVFWLTELAKEKVDDLVKKIKLEEKIFRHLLVRRREVE